ncbi:hypothetical protein HMPREF1982_03869 [Clostridiales bacterium oral taxon 876 str. F0540]|nr:hypothetical protein HMPREF1982_03869 [Clostridiales bacterium oral taxon 876 str. F0540]
MSKHRHRQKATARNPSLDPNMLLILLIILGAYSRKPVYYFDNELINHEHKKGLSKDMKKENDIGYTGGVLNENNDSQDEGSSNIVNESSGYEGDMFIENSNPQIEDSNPQYDGYMSMDDNSMENLTMENLIEENVDCSNIISTEVIPEYSNKLITPDIDCDEIIAQVPVILSQFELEFACETIIKLEYPALDIKRTKKNVFLDECKLLTKVNKLFLGGIVRKNIEYGTENNIRHATVEVPFKCTTKVEYFTLPVINSADEEIEIETLRSDGEGTDLSETTRISKENFNEKIYCKLVSDEINELDILDEDKGEDENPECERMFETLSEKMIIKLNLKLIQEQEISIKK